MSDFYHALLMAIATCTHQQLASYLRNLKTENEIL
jgi:hypothetical protein